MHALLCLTWPFCTEQTLRNALIVEGTAFLSGWSLIAMMARLNFQQQLAVLGHNEAAAEININSYMQLQRGSVCNN